MKCSLVSAGFLAASSLTLIAQGAEQDSRVERLEQQVHSLRQLVDELNQQLSVYLNQKALEPPKAQVVSLPAGSGASYKVKRGDTLWAIAKKHRISVNKLQQSNPSLNPKRLRIGLSLTIPGAQSSSHSPPPAKTSSRRVPKEGNYRIQSGDTLGHIAEAHGIRLHELLTANPGVNPRKLLVGSSLVVPKKSTRKAKKKVSKTQPPSSVTPKLPPEPEIQPISTQPIDEPRLITVEQTQRLSYLAELYGTDVHTINALNDLNLLPEQKIQAGSQLYVPKR